MIFSSKTLSGASRHKASEKSQKFKPHTNTSTFTVLNAGKEMERKKKCAPHLYQANHKKLTNAARYGGCRSF